MRFDKFTIKAQETLRKAQETAAQNNHQAIEPEHLLSAMLEEPESIARAIISKMGASPENVRGETAAALADPAQQGRVLAGHAGGATASC